MKSPVITTKRAYALADQPAGSTQEACVPSDSPDRQFLPVLSCEGTTARPGVEQLPCLIPSWIQASVRLPLLGVRWLTCEPPLGVWRLCLLFLRSRHSFILSTLC